jgi:hypothetical protein
MASDLTITSNYAGELALPYIAAAVISGDSIAKGYVTLHENVKYKSNLSKLALASLVQAASGSGHCDFEKGVSTATITENVLTVTDLKTNLELCKNQFARQWEALNTGRGFINDTLPSTFADFLMAQLALEISANIERQIWVGNFSGSVGGASGYTSFDGLLKKISDAKSSTPDYNIAAALTTANIMTAIDGTLATLTTALVGSPNTKCYMSPKTYQLYKQALMNQISVGGYMTPASTEMLNNVYGYEIYCCPGFSNDVIMFAQASNLHVGTDLVSDLNEVKLIDMSMTDGSDNVRVAMKYRVGTQIGFASDIAIGF